VAEGENRQARQTEDGQDDHVDPPVRLADPSRPDQAKTLRARWSAIVSESAVSITG
jgi:hypothetical protein